MGIAVTPELDRARENTRQASRILSLFRLPITRSGATFTLVFTIYADMLDPLDPLDPLGTGERRRAACLAMLEPIREQAIVEERGVRVERSGKYCDPYRLEFTTTVRGALLESCAALPGDAIAGYGTVRIVPAHEPRRCAS